MFSIQRSRKNQPRWKNNFAIRFESDGAAMQRPPFLSTYKKIGPWRFLPQADSDLMKLSGNESALT